MSKTEEMKLVLSRLDGPKRTPGLLLDRALTLAFLKIIGEMSFRLACSFAIFHALIGRGVITCATAFFIVGVPCLCLMVHLSLKWHQRIVDSIVSLGLGITLGNLLLFFLVWSVILDTDLILRFAPYFVGVSFFECFTALMILMVHSTLKKQRDQLNELRPTDPPFGPQP